MNKKEEKWRNEGAAYALRVAKDKGIDGLERDLRCRGALGLSTVIPHKAAEELYGMLAERILCTVKVMDMWTLYEEDGWRSVRLKRFSEQMDKHSEMCTCLDSFGKNYVRISDMAKELQERCGIRGDIDTLSEIEQENRKKNRFISVDAVAELMREHGQEDLANALLSRWEDNTEA